jgi:ATP-dependent DNA helicase RecG
MNSVYNFSVSHIAGIGPAYVERLAKLEIYTLFDLLLFMPRLYQMHKVGNLLTHLEPGDKTIVTGKVLEQIVQERRKRMLTAMLDCQGENLLLKFFHFYPNQQKILSPGHWVRVTGDVRKNFGYAEMIHPRIELIEEPLLNTELSIPATAHIEPIYPLTEGLNNQKIRQFIAQAIKHLQQQPLPELLPLKILEKFNWADINAALIFLHQPTTAEVLASLNDMRHPLQERLSFEELLAHRLALKQQQTNTTLAPNIVSMDDLVDNFLNLLAFKPTQAQWRCFNEIKQDLAVTRPMLRLLQGDVGAGKTLVAQLSALLAIGQKYQVAFMAPTEILAEQHYLKTFALFERLGIQVAYLTGKLTAKNKKLIYEQIKNGAYDIVIGTHALIQKDVIFKNLGLVIIDEQHRFGVSQRLSLQQKGAVSGLMPHQLIMTATPIPRTLAMSIYADLAISTIDELPSGRKPIQTSLLSQEKRDALIARIAKACEQKKQVYWVCPLIEASEVTDLEAAEVTYQRLVKELPHLAIGLIHGRMKTAEKSKIMAAFKAHQLDLLVATTVIEVGVDVPNASIMVIENPERMGLSQLHQLRGRVGRGTEESYCVLLYQAPMGKTSYQRLLLMRDHHDGFYLAEEDLRIRGPGEFLGTRQTGGVNFRLASLMRNAPMLKTVNETAHFMQIHHPESVSALIARWFGTKTQFINA